MPKIIDHDKYRKELAEKATKIFRKHGFSGLGMRKIAQELGISKSALYHYFPSKDALFEAGTKAATSFDKAAHKQQPVEEMSQEERIKALVSVFEEIDKDFKGEMSLLVDYVRPLSPSQVAADSNMQLANKRYLSMVSEYTGENKAQFVLCLMYGVLLQRLFDGGTYQFQDIEKQLLAVLR